ncbi:MAG: hypothetical protein LBP19_03365 [Treponema sp.]|jgi:hypothetical protein|nr:hypothetical protein [Treponema sp.]
MKRNAALFEQLPHITRAREFRLYAANGKRYVDLWQAGGAALLGHTPPHVVRELKNTAERGLFAPLPNHLEARLLKALAKLLPGYSFYLYVGDDALYRALNAYGFNAHDERPRLFDPAFDDETENQREPTRWGLAALWRPFLPADMSAYPLLVPVAPWHLAPKMLAVRNGAFPAGRPPASDVIPPVILAATTRAIYDLLAEIERGGRGAPHVPVVTKALAASGWRQKGIYLRPCADKGGYDALFRRFLEGGFVLPPDPEQPAILPAVLSAGEEAKLAALIRE